MHAYPASPMAALLLIVTAPSYCPAAATSVDVPPVDLSRQAPSDFSDEELVVPYYLAHFHRVANSVLMSGPNRGFISLPVWRPKKFNEPYNARVLENYVTFAYFYTADRPWNPYRGHAAVRARLEALLDFWCRSQNDDGLFSEYKPKGWNLPATGFATMFMGETLRMLKQGPPIDVDLLKRVEAAHRKAIRALLTNDALFNAGKGCSNQYSGLWGGALAHFDVCPHADLRALMKPMLVKCLAHHQSPAGYWYENHACDWPYTLRTHAGNLLMAWHYGRKTDLADLFVRAEQRWTEWQSYNCLREPDGSYVLNLAINSRTRTLNRTRHNPIAERVVLQRAFLPTRDEAAQAVRAKRRELEKAWPEVPELEVGTSHTYSPHPILNLHHFRWCPTEIQRSEAIRQLPYIARDCFTHQRADARTPQTITFVRRPAYYAVFNAGKQRHGQQRFGLGMVWCEPVGTIVLARPGSYTMCWGTRPDKAKAVVETQLSSPSFRVAGEAIKVVPGPRDLPEGDLSVSYALGKAGKKTVAFTDTGINVRIEAEGAFSEQIPLRLPDGASVRVDGNVATVLDKPVRFIVTVEGPATLVTKPQPEPVEGKRATVLVLKASDRLTYTMSFGELPRRK